ncbi:MAG TPA: protein kinase [Polyangiaceae bacterium]|jgi:serine/threonine-protein kinase
MTTSPSLVATVLDGKFRIERALGSGAAGDVYEATHLTLGSRVAVKVLRDGEAANGEGRRRRFMHEAQVAAGIQSEHVVRVFDFAAHAGGLTYIVMELLEGETLGQRVRRAGPLPVATAVDYLIQAATPLALLHEKGIVHRDVKPSNLFLARDSEGKERVKLLDFGIAAFRRSPSETSLTGARQMMGTPRYMAPEQVRGAANVDARADVWALGVTLYELLAGRPPFDAQSLLAVLKHIEKKQPAPLEARRSGLPPKLVAVVQRCMEKDPERRPASARAVVDALAALRGSLDEAASPEATGDALDLSWNDPDVQELRPVRRDARRRTVMAAVGLGACALVVIGFAMRRPGPVAPITPVPAAASPAPTEAPPTATVPVAVPTALRAEVLPSAAAATSRAPTVSVRPPPKRAAGKPTLARPTPSKPAAPARDDDVPLE